MTSIKQKIKNFILSFISLTYLSACQSTLEQKAHDSSFTEVAILMPMSGAGAEIGQQYNKLIKMGLEISAKTSIKVTSYDGADERQISNSIDKIIARDTKIILGPINSPLTTQIAERARKNGIIVITMSNNPALANGKLYVFGHAPLKQLDIIVNYFLDNEYRNFISMLPAGSHSQNLTKIIQDMTIQKNATLVRAEYYRETPESIDKAVNMVSDAVDNLNEMEDNIVKPVIYIGDDQENLKLVFDSIDKYNLDKKAIICGDNRIDLESHSNMNISFTGSLNILNSNISEKAKELGIVHMNSMHAMAYDLGRMTAKYIGDKFSHEQFLAKMNSKELFVGISGRIYFADFIAQRNYDIIKRDRWQL